MKIKITLIVLILTIVLTLPIIYSQECEICIEDPSVCPPECFAGPDDVWPPLEGNICGDNSCDYNEDCELCPQDCGICEKPVQQCIESWKCLAWDDCKEDILIRSCSDSNNCGTSNNKPDVIRTCLEELEENITVTENINLEVIQTLTSNLTNISESTDIVNKSLQRSKETELSNNFVEKADANLQENIEKLQVDNKWASVLNNLNKKSIFPMFLIGFSAFIFVILLIFNYKKRKIKKLKIELIESIGIKEDILNHLIAYIKINLDKGFKIEIIKKKLIDTGYEVHIVEKVIDHIILRQDKKKSHKSDSRRNSLIL